MIVTSLIVCGIVIVSSIDLTFAEKTISTFDVDGNQIKFTAKVSQVSSKLVHKFMECYEYR